MNNYHRGQIVEKVIKGDGYKLKNLALKLGVSRGTLYKYFNQADLSSEFIIKLGRIIKHDFRQEIPSLVEDMREKKVEKEVENVDDKHDEFNRELEQELVTVQRKYYELLEEYTNVISFLVKISTEKQFEALNARIRELIKHKNFS